MKKWFIIAILISITLSACGVKGPLYFPEETQQQQS